MLQSHQRLFHRSVLTADLGFLLCGAAVAHLEATPVSSLSTLVQPLAAVVAWLGLSSRIGLYRSHRTAPLRREFELLAIATVGAIALAVLVGHLVHGASVFHPGEWLAISGLGLLSMRAGIRVALRESRRRGHNFRRALIVGGGARADSLAHQIESKPTLGIRLIGFVAFRGQREPVAQLEARGGVTELQQLVTGQRGHEDSTRVDVVIVCPPPSATSAEIEQVVELCGAAGIPCQFAPDFLRLDGTRPALEFYGNVPTLSPAPCGRSNLQYVVKSIFDFVGAALLLLLLAPLLCTIAAAVRVDSRGPVLFRQRRVGRGGKSFSCLKFRTMRVGAEAQRAALEAANEQDGPVFKIEQDPRITRIGAFLRKYSLDELPQLFNVLRGEMSLVGPRPPIPEEVTRYEWWQRRRVSVRPGLTCIWQTKGRNRVSFQEWMEMDLDYLENWSLWLDFKILCNTAGTVLRGTGV